MRVIVTLWALLALVALVHTQPASLDSPSTIPSAISSIYSPEVSLPSSFIPIPSPSAILLPYNFSLRRNPPPDDTPGICTSKLYDPVSMTLFATLCTEIPFYNCNLTISTVTSATIGSGARKYSLFVPYANCTQYGARGACSDGEFTCWVSTQMGCEFIAPFVTPSLTWHADPSCEAVTLGPSNYQVQMKNTSCEAFAANLGFSDFGSCNGSVFEFSPTRNVTEVILRVLNVARGQSLLVRGNLSALNAFIYGTLITAPNASVTLSANTTVGSEGGLDIDGSFASVILVAAPSSSISLSQNGSLVTSSLVLRNSTLAVSLSSHVSTEALTVGDGTSLVIRVTDSDLRSPGSNYSFTLSAAALAGNFTSVRVDLGQCLECERTCLATEFLDSQIAASSLQVTFRLHDDPNGSCTDKSLATTLTLAPVLASALAAIICFHPFLL